MIDWAREASPEEIWMHMSWLDDCERIADSGFCEFATVPFSLSSSISMYELPSDDKSLLFE